MNTQKNMDKLNNELCIFILTHGRPNNDITYNTLKKLNCTYPIYLIIDNEDKDGKKYIEKFGKENVIIFDKLKESKKFDTADNFNNRKTIVYARNASFDIAKKLGYKYFLQLDDDYTYFSFRINGDKKHPTNHYAIKTRFNEIIKHTLNYYKSINVKSIAFSQGGDWFGGGQNFGKFKRKAMNTFFCSTDRPFQFIGRINEDVNTYTNYQSKGNVFFSIPFIQMNQLQTQSNDGGMTDVYLLSGTYIKSFYTIIFSPSCCVISLMGRTNKRLHHRIKWDNAVPKIIDEKNKK